MKKKLWLLAVAAGTLLCGVGCGEEAPAASVAGPKDTALQAWATSEELSFEIGTEYEVPNAVVKDSEGKDFTPAYTVYDAEGKEVVLIQGAFLMNDVAGYKIVYSVIDDGNTYEKTVNAKVSDTKGPDIIVGEFANGYLGFGYEFPNYTVIDNSNVDLTPVLSLVKVDGETETPVACTAAGFTPETVGNYKLTYKATDAAGNVGETVRQFTIAPFDGMVQGFDDEASFRTSFGLVNNRIEWLAEYKGYTGVAKGTFDEYWAHWPQFNFTPMYEDADVYRAFDYVTMTMYIEQDVTGENEGKGIYAGNFAGTGYSTKVNEWFTVELPISVLVDNYAKFNYAESGTSAMYLYNDRNYNADPALNKDPVPFSFYIAEIKAICKEQLMVAEYEKEAVAGKEYTLPDVYVNYGGKPLADKEIGVTATFNGEAIDITDGKFTPTVEGNLIVTYTYEDQTVTANVTFKFPSEIVLNTALMYVDDNVNQVTGGSEELENPIDTWVTDITGATASGVFKRNDGWYVPGIVCDTSGTSGSVTLKLNGLNADLNANDYKYIVFDIFVMWSNQAASFTFGDETFYTITGQGSQKTYAWTASAANFDGTLTFDVPDGQNFSIVGIRLYGEPTETIKIESYEKKADVGAEIEIPVAKVMLAGVEVPGKTVTATAKFNGVDVDITSGTFTSTEDGVLVIAYTCGDLTATATVEFILAKTLVATDAMPYVTNAKTSFTIPSWAQFGDYMGKTVDALVWNGGSEAAANQSLTFSAAFVAELKLYQKVELTFVFEGQDGANVSFTANGVSTENAGNGVKTLTFVTADWDGTIACTPLVPEWGCYYKVYVCNVTGLGVKTSIPTETIATNTMDYFTTTATVQDVSWPAWANTDGSYQFGTIAGTTAKAIHFRTHDTYTVTFNAAFVEAAKKYRNVELSMTHYENGWGIIYTANGTSLTEAGNKTFTFTFSTIGWDGTMTLAPKNPTWGGGQHDSESGYNVHIFEAIAYGEPIVTKVLKTAADGVEWYTTTAEKKQVTFPHYEEMGTLANQTLDVIHYNKHSETYTLTFLTEFTIEAKTYDWIEFDLGIFDDGWGTAFTANGTTVNLSGNYGSVKLRFSTEGWDGVISFQAKNQWNEEEHTSGYNIFINSVTVGRE